MISMGSTCSMQRQHSEGSYRRNRRSGSIDSNSMRSSLRHSVVCAIPDRCIASLYPVEDNYVNIGNGVRSPKSLSELCVDALCRSLPYLNGELPPGLPQDVVVDVIESLVHHSALNETTLRVLRNCELERLSLAGCRGVTDSWLEPLGHSPSSSPQVSAQVVQNMESVETMELDTQHPTDVFYRPFHHARLEEISCDSSSSFVSESSKQGNVLTDSYVGMDSKGLTEDRPPKQVAHRSSSWCSSVTSNLTLLDFCGSQGLTDRGLLQLTDLSNLEVVKLDACHSLSGRGLLALSNSHRLHTLSLANCRRVTDEAVINISHLLSLEALSLDGCRCLTDHSLAAISDLYGLRKLDLSQCDLLTDEGVEQLVHLESLEELSLGWCRQVTDRGVQSLTRPLERASLLRILCLARCSISDEGVRHLAKLKALEELDFNGCVSIGSTALGETLQHLKHVSVLDVSHCPGILRSDWQGKINSLKALDLCYSSVKDSHINNMLNLSTLEELNLDSCLIGDSAIAHLADRNVVPNLTSLDLADTRVTDIGMAKIATFGKLTRLSLFYCNISNGGMRHLAKLTELEVLNLDSRDISDDGLSHLRTLTKLRSLDVFSGRITDTGCGYIAAIKSLESLELCGGGIGDLGCTFLAGLENLASLNLSQNERISNRGAAALATLTHLKQLNLSNTRVNSNALKFFSGLLRLQSLALYGCRGIEDESVIGKLQHGLPNLKCLRLNTTSDEDGMVVERENYDDLPDEMWSSLEDEARVFAEPK